MIFLLLLVMSNRGLSQETIGICVNFRVQMIVVIVVLKQSYMQLFSRSKIRQERVRRRKQKVRQRFRLIKFLYL